MDAETRSIKIHGAAEFAAMRKAGKLAALGVGSADDLAASVLPWVSASPWLSRLARICYYGFYDLTQVQLSLFEAITRAREVTLYFPLGSEPAFAFARKFFERHIEPMAGPARATVPLSCTKPSPMARIMNAAGPDAELAAACKELVMNGCGAFLRTSRLVTERMP